MKYIFFSIFFISLLSSSQVVQSQFVYKKVLENGFTILVRPTHTLQKVSTQLWVNVGSKHEKNNERGLAHWLEHMIFKGTSTMTEQDLWLATTKLSGTCNAATSYDWTHFYLDFPVQHWYEALPIFADVMQHCTFKEDLMNAEVQVVIQELKMYKDHFSRALLSNMISSIFDDHPYHYPVIGYKNDLKKLTRKALLSFYKKHYVPANSLLVIVGNVVPDEVFQQVEKYFGSIPAKRKPCTQEVFHQFDISSQNTILYRNVQQPTINMSYVIPGLKVSDPYIHHILMLVLCNMKQSRLKKMLLDDFQLINWITCSDLELFDYDLFRISFEPKKYTDASRIITLIQKEINKIAQHGITNDELTAAVKQITSSYYSFLENNHDQATAIATSYLARNDENFVFERYVIEDVAVVSSKIKEFAQKYLRPWVMHKGCILPLPADEMATWQKLQEQSNKEDTEILKDKQRHTELETPSYSLLIEPKNPIDSLIPQPEVITLKNGLTVYYYHNQTVPKISLILKLKADSVCQKDHQCGIFGIVTDMLLEGTQRYSKTRLMKALSKHGIQIDIKPGSIHMDMMQQDFPKAFELLEEIVVRPLFDKHSFQKVKSLTLVKAAHFLENQNNVAQKLVDEYFYDKHPYSKNILIDKKIIDTISLQDLTAFHQKYFTPHNAVLVIVGNLQEYDIPKFIETTIAHWQGPEVSDIVWPEIIPNIHRPTTHYFEREQVILKLAALSTNRHHPDFYKILLFDTVLHEKLFALRSQSGLFYSISGSLLHGSGEQPGLVCITANVSQSYVQQAEHIIRQALPQCVTAFNEHDLKKAKLEMLNRPSEAYSTNSSIAATFAFLHHYNLPFDYYTQRAKIIGDISLEEVQQAVSKLLDPARLVTFKVGRVFDEAKG